MEVGAWGASTAGFLAAPMDPIIVTPHTGVDVYVRVTGDRLGDANLSWLCEDSWADYGRLLGLRFGDKRLSRTQG